MRYEHRFAVDDTRFSASELEGDAVTIASVPHSYEVSFDDGADAWGALVEHLERHPLSVAVVDARVARLHGEGRPLPEARALLLDATEDTKTLSGFERILAFFDEARLTKQSQVVVVGGGIIQDVSAFACALYRRGTPWLFLPTTLLAQSDSCIGAKAGLNRLGAKNQLGLFSAPRSVRVHSAWLRTLDARDLRSGLGEILKLHITGGPEAMRLYRSERSDDVTEVDAIAPLVRRALAVKRAVIERDEFESGLRRCLNYGHTFGHAIEGATEYRIAHGTAVVLGMMLVNELSATWGLLERAELEGLHAACRALIGDDDREVLREVSTAALLELVRKDKKAGANSITLALVETVGQMRLRSVAIDRALESAVDDAIDQLAWS
jgi:3-dehydroquinate synthase